MSRRRWAPKPWEEAYRTQGRLWGGSRLDAPTAQLLDTEPALGRAAWLDLGCGDGKGLVPLAARLDAPRPPVGCDLARWGLRRVRDALEGDPATRASTKAAPGPVPLVQADARALPFADGSFDAVRAVHVVGHLLDAGPARAAVEARRVLRPGGVLVSTEFGREDFRVGKGEPVEPWTWRRGTGIVTRYHTAAGLRGLWMAAGLEVVRVDTERFSVTYGGVARPRERHTVVARRT